jgi:hypothetical protein
VQGGGDEHDEQSTWDAVPCTGLDEFRMSCGRHLSFASDRFQFTCAIDVYVLARFEAPVRAGGDDGRPKLSCNVRGTDRAVDEMLTAEERLDAGGA